MTNDTQACVAVLTRCGPYSRLQALALVPQLVPGEVKELLALAAELGQLEQKQQPPAEYDRRLAAIGDRFHKFRNDLADRCAAEAQKHAGEKQHSKQIVGTGEP
jgi:acyl-CoA reductase-like NAD-dependent aldehyde dehydrogenase